MEPDYYLFPNEKEATVRSLIQSKTELENQVSRLKNSISELEKTNSALLNFKESIQKAFDDEVTSDVTFIVEGEKLHAHKSLLEIRCEHFRTMFKDCWQKTESPIEITQSSFKVYKALLYYLYSDDVEMLPMDDLVELMDLAMAYFEPVLKEKCEDLLIKEVNEETVAKLYGAAVKYEAKKLIDHCLHFCKGRMAIIVQTDAFNELEAEVVRLMVKDLALKNLL